MASLPEFDGTQYRYPSPASGFAVQWDDTYALLLGAEKSAVLDMPYRTLSNRLDLMSKPNLLENLPEENEINPLRFSVMSEQLWLLGYLQKKLDIDSAAKAQSSKSFKTAVRRFQREANLIVDGWIGNQTWRALDELVGFESEIKLADWAHDNATYYKAFLRAAQLRLWSYGMANTKPSKNFSEVSHQNISRLKKALWSLGLIANYRDSIGHGELYSLLFDPDSLVAAAALCEPDESPKKDQENKFRDRKLDAAEHVNVKAIKRRFLANLAKVELWLLGSDIKIDGKDDFPVAGLPVRKVKTRIRATITGRPRFRTREVKDKEVQIYLQHYWREFLGASKKKSKKQSKSISPNFFHSLRSPELFDRQISPEFKEEDYSQEIIKYFEEGDSKNLIEKSYDLIKKVGMILWDGLKRMWRWIKKGAKKVVKFAKNMLRAFSRFALKAYTIVRTAFTALARSLEQYLSGHIDLNDDYTVTVFIKKDMDMQVFITKDNCYEEITIAKKALQRFSAMFMFSCRIIGALIDGIQSMITGLTGWAKLLMVLVKSYRKLKPAYRELLNIINATK